MGMTPEHMRIDDRQLDDALRTLATTPAPDDLPAQVLSAIAAEAHGWWVNWRPALVAAVVGLMALTAIAVWRLAPSRPGHIVVSRMAPAPRPTSVPDGPAQPRSSATGEALGSGLTAPGTEAADLRTVAPRRAHGSRLMAQGGPPLTQGSVPMAQGDGDGVPPLEPPAPLTIAQLQTPELSERQLQLTALDVPALEIETLER